MNTSDKKLTLSIVSHGHLPLIISLLDDVLHSLDFKFIDIILTINVKEN